MIIKAGNSHKKIQILNLRANAQITKEKQLKTIVAHGDKLNSNYSETGSCGKNCHENLLSL